MARKFGFGNSYLENIFIPKRNYTIKELEKNQYGRTWNKTDTVVTSIGQGFTLASPLQLAVMIKNS